MQTLDQVDLSSEYKKIHKWKVRDTFLRNWMRIIVVSDRVSAFDQNITAIPYKWQVLNQISSWWFNNTKDIVSNHVIDIPDSNVMITKTAKMFPVEVVVRGYITWSTDTSIWVNYQKWIRNFCGNKLPEWLKKNTKLVSPIITPTTKPEIWHDKNISKEEIINEWLISEWDWYKIEKMAMNLYLRWVEIAEKRGLIFVDTKYEFGKDQDWNIIVCDEVNTPDSSRYWILETYEEKIKNSLEPENLDKEFLRLKLKELWFHDWNIPKLSSEFINKVSEKYISLYEKITWEKFIKWDYSNINLRIENNLNKYFSKFNL